MAHAYIDGEWVDMYGHAKGCDCAYCVTERYPTRQALNAAGFQNYAQATVYAQQNARAQIDYSDFYRCLNRPLTNAGLAQQDVPHSPYDFSDYYPCREMTREDLGLPNLHPDIVMQLLRQGPISDAPYAFWLGDVSYCAKHNNLYATVCRACEP